MSASSVAPRKLKLYVCIFSLISCGAKSLSDMVPSVDRKKNSGQILPSDDYCLAKEIPSSIIILFKIVNYEGGDVDYILQTEYPTRI